MGEDSALDAVPTLVEKLVSLDLLADAAKPLDKMVVATLGYRWFGDQLINNTVIVRQGLNGEVFVKLPDGSHNPSPGNAASPWPTSTTLRFNSAICSSLHDQVGVWGLAVISTPRARITASVVFRVGLPCSLKER